MRSLCYLCLLLFTSVASARAQTWTQTTAPITNWTAVASSADGSKLVAVVGGGGIYCSADSGLDWRATPAPIAYWKTVASSADGSNLVAATSIFSGGAIYFSRDSGASWTVAAAPPEAWYSVASTADGSRLVAVVGPDNPGYGPIYLSTNSGALWIEATNLYQGWLSVASSADGTKLVAVSYCTYYCLLPGWIFTSRDSGFTWSGTSAPSLHWFTVVSSADGARLVATGSGGVYTSKDYGITWTLLTNAPGAVLAASADGLKLFAVRLGIYTSTDSGLTWSGSDAPRTNWSSLASSADGTKAAAAVQGGGIWTSQSLPTRCDDLQIPDGNALKFHAYAIGAQIYRWNGTNWVFVAPSATLYADPGYHGQVAIHYAGPTWESKSGSKVVGTRLAACAPDATAIPWLKLGAVSSQGPGVFDGVTFIQRVNTVGGIAPAIAGTAVGQVANVPYNAEYFFYSPID